MKKDSYHHGDLKYTLINRAIEILKNEDVDKLSLRSIANDCGVSHAAPYKHFKNKEELLSAVRVELFKIFNNELENSIKSTFSPKENLSSLGLCYVNFMVKNPTYFTIMFASPYIPQHDNNVVSYPNAFSTFKNCAISFLKEYSIDECLWEGLVLTLWSMVHGLSSLIINNVITNEDKNYEPIARNMIDSAIKIFIATH